MADRIGVDVGERIPLIERFWLKVDTSGPCWLWTGARTGAGYGKLYRNGRAVEAHRVAYELFVGPIPPGLDLDHLCRNRACVNPAHLEPVTRSVNLRRGAVGRSGATAINRGKTHCKRKHEFTPENTVVDRRGRRNCRICKRDAARQRYRDRVGLEP